MCESCTHFITINQEISIRLICLRCLNHPENHEVNLGPVTISWSSSDEPIYLDQLLCQGAEKILEALSED